MYPYNLCGEVFWIKITTTGPFMHIPAKFFSVMKSG